MAPIKLATLVAALAAALALVALPTPAAAQPGPPALSATPTRSASLADASSGCGSAQLSANLNDCVVQASIERGLVHELTFVVPPRGGDDTPFSVLLTLKSIGGNVEM